MKIFARYFFWIFKAYYTVDFSVYAIEGTGKFRINEEFHKARISERDILKVFKGPENFRINERVS
jgi:hypothetical protein